MIRRHTWPLSRSPSCSPRLPRDPDSSPDMYPTSRVFMPKPRILLYILRRDIRLSDNPIFHCASLVSAGSHAGLEHSTQPMFERQDTPTTHNDILNFTHLLPVYVFPANQVEVSGFLPPGLHRQSPYPQARSQVAKLWRTGPYRAKFLAEGIWSLKRELEGLGCGSGLEIRVGIVGEVVEHILDWYARLNDKEQDSMGDVVGIWMTNEEGSEEKKEEVDVTTLANDRGIQCKVWDDVKYYIDECVNLPHHDKPARPFKSANFVQLRPAI